MIHRYARTHTSNLTIAPVVITVRSQGWVSPKRHEGFPADVAAKMPVRVPETGCAHNGFHFVGSDVPNAVQLAKSVGSKHQVPVTEDLIANR